MRICFYFVKDDAGVFTVCRTKSHSLSERLDHGRAGRPPQRVHDQDTRPEEGDTHVNSERRRCCLLLAGWQYCARSLSADGVFGGQGGGGVGSQAVVGQRPVLAAVVLQDRKIFIDDIIIVTVAVTSCNFLEHSSGALT